MSTEDPVARRPRWSVPAVVAVYLASGLLWIGGTTPLAEELAERLGVAPTTVELGKGVGFVLVTSVVLYATLRGWEAAYRRSAAQRQQDLVQRERRFRHLAEETEGAVYRLRFTPETELEYISPQFEELSGYSAEQLFADPGLLLAGVAPEHRDRLALLALDDPRAGPTQRAVSTFRYQRADGEWIWLEDHHTPEVGADGRIDADQGIVFDVTARHQHEEARASALEHERAASEQLRRAVDAHQAFLSGISHELRTPLTAVLGFARTLQNHVGSLTPEAQRDVVERLTSNANRLGRLLDDLLDLDRLDRGVLEVTLDDVDLAQLVATIVGELDAPGHDIAVEVPSTRVRVDRPKVERILDNLVRNAVRHTPPGTIVRVVVGPDEGGVLLVVEDDGPGVDGDVDELFQAFRQGEAAASSASPGTGIGLSLVREFARVHGGEAWYEDREPHGARFCVLLPSGR